VGALQISYLGKKKKVVPTNIKGIFETEEGKRSQGHSQSFTLEKMNQFATLDTRERAVRGGNRETKGNDYSPAN